MINDTFTIKVNDKSFYAMHVLYRLKFWLVLYKSRILTVPSCK